jgi:hypothetical protein
MLKTIKWSGRYHGQVVLAILAADSGPTKGSLLLSLFHSEADCHVSRNTSRDWYAGTHTGPSDPQLC